MSDLDFEQRHRLETEVLPAVIDDPEYAAATIVRLDAQVAALEKAIRCPYGRPHQWNGDGQCKNCFDYATDLIDNAVAGRK